MTSLMYDMCYELVGWKKKLPLCWRDAIGDMHLDFSALGHAWGSNSVTCGKIWPDKDNIFKAFQKPEVAPDRVRVVILGKEPYAKEDQATGRAFEQGDISVFGRNNIKYMRASIRGLMLAVSMAKCTGNTLDGLAELWARKNQVRIKNQARLFDSWESQGVMWLNASLTFSEGDHADKHIALWKPLIEKVFEVLGRRDGEQPIIFALWGVEARKSKEYIQQHLRPENFCVLESAHPSSRKYDYFMNGNPLLAINKTLEHFGCPEIDWWPNRPNIQEGKRVY